MAKQQKKVQQPKQQWFSAVLVDDEKGSVQVVDFKATNSDEALGIAEGLAEEANVGACWHVTAGRCKIKRRVLR